MANSKWNVSDLKEIIDEFGVSERQAIEYLNQNGPMRKGSFGAAEIPEQFAGYRTEKTASQLRAQMEEERRREMEYRRRNQNDPRAAVSQLQWEEEPSGQRVQFRLGNDRLSIDKQELYDLQDRYKGDEEAVKRYICETIIRDREGRKSKSMPPGKSSEPSWETREYWGYYESEQKDFSGSPRQQKKKSKQHRRENKYGSNFTTYTDRSKTSNRKRQEYGDVIHYFMNHLENKMANKFLPFIVKKSKPPHIYQTLLSRSKGLNYATIASVLYIVIKRGIEDVRSFVVTLPELPLEKLYEEIISHWQQDRVPSEVMDRYLNLTSQFDKTDYDKWSDDLKEFDVKDIMIFMMVMSLMGVDYVKEYTELDFMSVVSNYDTIMSNIPKYVKFSDTGFTMEFSSRNDLEAYILYTALLNPDGEQPTPVKAVFKKAGD